MKNRTLYILAVTAALILIVASANAQGFGPGPGDGVCNFVDEDGDGFNDLAPDHDGDGIPNGLDPDWVRPEDGSGLQHRYGFEDLAALFAKSFGEAAAGYAYGYENGYAHGQDGAAQFGPGEAGGFGPGSDTSGHVGDGTGEGTGSGTGSGGNNSGGNGNGQGGNS